MKQEGLNMWNDPLDKYTQEDVKAMLREIIDDKYAE